MFIDHTKADRACNLECLAKKPPIHEFTGPVKILLIDIPKPEYNCKMCVAGFIGLGNILMGATTMIVIFYTMSYKLPLFMNLHIVLCTVAFQLLIPSAILMMNPLNGPAAPLKVIDRKCQHAFLQIVGLACAIGGLLLAFDVICGNFSYKFTPHSISGLAAVGLGGFAALFGPGVLIFKKESKCGKCFRKFHMFFGVLALIASTICFILGLMSHHFNAWLPLPDMLYFLYVFCVLTTLVVIIVPVMKILGQTMEKP